MNLLDGIISYISPRAGAQRNAYRFLIEEQKSYDAGNNRRLNSGWAVNNQSAEMEDRYNRDIIRARARDLEKNSDIVLRNILYAPIFSHINQIKLSHI